MNVRFQLPLVGRVRRNGLNVGPDPENPMATGFRPPAALKTSWSARSNS
jgi:hypothetical protein